MRGFRCVPIAVLFATVMAEATTFQRDFMYSAQLGQDDRHCLPHDAATLRSIIFPTRPHVSVGDVARARDHFVAVGAFIRKASARKEWLEIAPAFRHDEGQNSTSFGEEDPLPAQGTLPLGICGVAPAKTGPRGRVPKAINRLQSREEQKRTDPESAQRPAQHPTSNIQRPTSNGGDSKTRATSRGKDSPEHFAKDEADRPRDDLWGDLCRFLGLQEMTRNGAMWEQRRALSAEALRRALQDGQDNARTVGNRAAYVTERYDAHGGEPVARKGVA